MSKRLFASVLCLAALVSSAWGMTPEEEDAAQTAEE